MSRPVEWGWRVTCLAPGCSRHVEGWGTKGTPPLPPAGAHASGPLAGWFLSYRKATAFEPLVGHVALCPAHAADGLAWLADMARWREARHEVGRRAHVTGLAERLADRLYPEPARRADRIRVGEIVHEWTKVNPVPRPPWNP